MHADGENPIGGAFPNGSIAPKTGLFSSVISLALGAKKDAGPAAGGHPFDIAVEVLAPAKMCCPYHAHAAQWEFFYILWGEGTVRRDGESFKVKPGDAIPTRSRRTYLSLAVK